MKDLIKKTFLLLIIAVNLAYLPQALIAIINNVPLISSIDFSYMYIEKGLNNNFPLIRYSKDVLIVILFLLISINLIIRKKISKVSALVFGITILVIIPFSILSLSFSDEFNKLMIIAGIRILIFPIVIIIFISEYCDYKFISSIYKILNAMLYLIFIITLLQSIITVNHFKNLNIAQYRMIGTFAGCGLLGLFGVGMTCFLVLYKIRINNIIYFKQKIVLLAFIIYASGTRTAMVAYLMIILSYVYSSKINKNRKFSLTFLYFMILIISTIFFLNISEVIAGRGDAISAQFEGGRIKFIIDYINSANIKEILFGKGIGFGTNTALSMMSELVKNGESNTRVMDGTINILITQFGVTFTLAIVLLYGYLIVKSLKANLSNEVKITFIITNIIFIIIGNTLEQFSFQILFIINQFVLIEDFRRKIYYDQ